MNRHSNIVYLLLFCALVSSTPTIALAQKQASIWYFGQYAGLDFNSGSPVALTDGALEIRGGSSSIADENGRLLFYTDGWNVWNRNHERMPGNGYRLNGGGDGSVHSGFIVPKPGSPTEYYIFTTDTPPPFGQYGLQYSIINMEAEKGLGDVVDKNIPLIDSVCTKIAITRHANGRDLWVVTQHMDTNAFYAFLVTEAGVSNTPVASFIGISPKTELMNSRGGQIKFSPDGTKLATALPRPIDRFQIMEFDRETGKLYNAMVSLPFAPTLFLGAFGIEFSPDSKKLYIGRYGTGIGQSRGNIFQYDLSVFEETPVMASGQTVVSNEHIESLQLAPDGKIYVCHGDDEKYISSIDKPNEKGTACGYSHKSVYLGGRTTNSCFPSFLTSYFRRPDVHYWRTCVGDTTFFALSQTAEVDSVRWDFGDPESADANVSHSIEPQHSFSHEGTYTVTLRVYSGWVSDLVTITVRIAPMPTVELGEDRELCMGTQLSLSAGEGGLSYLWSTGDTTKSIIATSSGEYWVLKQAGTCLHRDTVRLNFIIPELHLQQDTLLCLGQSLQMHAPEAVSYQWEPDDGLSDSHAAAPVATPERSTLYKLTIKDAEGCIRQGHVYLRVLPPDAAQLLMSDTVLSSSRQTVFLPIRMQISQQWLPLTLQSVEADIRFPNDAFDCDGLSSGTLTLSRHASDFVAHIRLTDLTLTQELDILTAMRGRVLLAQEATNLFVVENLRINGCYQDMTSTSNLSLDSSQTCLLNQRAIKRLELPQIIVRPHPALSPEDIVVYAVETGRHRLELYNSNGMLIQTYEFFSLGKQPYTVLSKDTLPSGVYNLVLNTPSGCIRRSILFYQ